MLRTVSIAYLWHLYIRSSLEKVAMVISRGWISSKVAQRSVPQASMTCTVRVQDAPYYMRTDSVLTSLANHPLVGNIPSPPHNNILVNFFDPNEFNCRQGQDSKLVLNFPGRTIIYVAFSFQLSFNYVSEKGRSSVFMGNVTRCVLWCGPLECGFLRITSNKNKPN